MSKASKIVLIIVAVLVAIGAAIGIYFAVKGRNPYTKEQQAFIDEIINSNKPNNPPVDIGGGTLPGGVIGEDETGDTVIVDTGTGSDEIWQKDPTDPDGGYGKVETPTTDDEGQPFTYQTVVQVCGNFALVKNDVGNHAVINLAESKVVLNYTDLQDAENLHMAGDVLFYTTPYVYEDASTDIYMETFQVYFVNLRAAKNDAQEVQYIVTDMNQECVFQMQSLNANTIALQGNHYFEILTMKDGGVQIQYSVKDEEILTYIKDYEDIDEENGNLEKYVLLGNKLYRQNIEHQIAVLNNETYFITKLYRYENYQANKLCIYVEDVSFTGYVSPEYMVLKANGKLTSWNNTSYIWVPQENYISSYSVFLRYSVISDDIKHKVVDTSTAKFVYFDANFQEVISISSNNGIIVGFDKELNGFVCKNDEYTVVDANGNTIYLIKDVYVYRYSADSTLLGGTSKKEGATSNYAIFTKSGKQLTDFIYENIYGPFANVMVGERYSVEYDDVTDESSTIVYYDFINEQGSLTTVAQSEIVATETLSYGYYIKLQNEKYGIYAFNGKAVATEVSEVVITTIGEDLLISYKKQDKNYTIKLKKNAALSINNMAVGSGLQSSATLGWASDNVSDYNTEGIDARGRSKVETLTEEVMKKHAGSTYTLEKNQFTLKISNIKEHPEWYETRYYSFDPAVLTVKPGYFIEGYAESYRFTAAIGNSGSEYFYLLGTYGTSAINVYNEDNHFKRVGIWYYYETSFNQVSFDGNGGSNDQSTITMKHGDSNVSVIVPDRRGYQFTGFYTSASGGTCVFDANGKQVGSYNVTKRGNVTLYAHWEALVTTVVFDDGQYTNSKDYTYGKPVSDPPAASEKRGYDFAGWYTKENGEGIQLFDSKGIAAIVGGYIKFSWQKGLVWDRDYDYNTDGANQITLYAHYTPKTMTVLVNVEANDEGVDTDQLSYALLGGSWGDVTSETYLYNATDVTNCIQIKMSEAKGYYISKFEIIWKTFNNDNELSTSLSGTSSTYESLEATNGIHNNVIQQTNSGRTVAIIPQKEVSGNTATYSFDFKSGTGQDSSYLNTWAIELTIYINIDLSITPPDTVQTSAESIHVEPVILPQNKKEEA